MAVKKRSFRINRLDAEAVQFALLFYLTSCPVEESPVFNCYRKAIERIYTKIDEYEWEVETK